ncbi:cytochrome P450 [Streptomyces sp. NPDC020800]|uniref:cytochrome P450 n=1 Tax=Streptomyces sp. NPDC020800 TaxID=3365092 RepID=UPI0037AA4E68
MPAGNRVIPGLVSANRGNAAFPGSATFDERRDSHHHLAFGAGPHFCLGAAFGRLELGIALGALLCRVPTLSLAVPESELRRYTETFT